MKLARCYIALGSNLNHPQQQLNIAKKAIDGIQKINVLKCSSIYQSKAITLDDELQADYLNAVIELDTTLDAEELLDTLQSIETMQGRLREKRWGARTLDLDIVLFSNQQIKSDRLTVPHVEIENRNFVLTPLAEISNEIEIPGKDSLDKLLENVSDQNLINIGGFDE